MCDHFREGLLKMTKQLLLCAFVLAGSLMAQDANPISAGNKMMFGMGQGVLVRAAEKMPEENYSFKPTPDIRSFGQLVGHVANAQYMFCGAVLGEKPETKNWEEVTAKAELVQGLKDAFAYCQKAYSITDADGATTVKFFGGDRAKISVLSFNNMHNYEHYGNMVTYLRLKGLVPPSSESAPAKPQPKKSGD